MNSIKEFFFLNLNQYENISINLPVGMLITLLTLFLCLAAFIINYQKSYTLAIIKQLTRHTATSPETAKTLKELHLDKKIGLKYSLSRSGRLTHIVKMAGEKKPSYEEYVAASKKRGFKEEKINFEEARFYIDPDKQDMAKRIMDTTLTAWWRPILMCVLITALSTIIAVILPDLLEYINNTAAN